MMKMYFRWLSAALRSEIRSTHAGSALGSVWLVLSPTLQVGMYVFLFQVVWRLKVNMSTDSSVAFVWFLISAYLPVWAFQEALVRAAAGFTGNAHIIRNTLFPPWVLIFAKGLVPYFVLCLICMPLWIVLHILNIFKINWYDILLLPYVVGCQILMTIGLAMLFGSIGVLLRDLSNVLPPFLMGLVLTSPVLYPIENVPEAFRSFFWLNPLTGYAEAYHCLLLTGESITFSHAVSIFLSAIVFVFFGVYAYRKIAPDLPDLL